MEERIEKRHLFKEGDEVAHKENTSQIMEVRRIVKRTKNNWKFIIGIECGWWNTDGEYQKEIFHTKVLVPWEIALKSLNGGGRPVIINWLENKV